MTRDEAYKLVTSWTTNKNLVKHMLAVEAAMGGIYGKLGNKDKNDESKWKVLGLIHDTDYEKYPDKHPLKLVEYLEGQNEDKEIVNAVKSHAWGFLPAGRQVKMPKPKTKMEWSLYCCDELTGFIVAVTLIRPTKKIKDVTVEDILKKWNKKDFAKGVNRSQIEMCEEKLGIKLNDFIQIVLFSMQQIAPELGL